MASQGEIATKQRRGILAVGAYIPRRTLSRQAIAAAHGWMAPGLKAMARGTRSVGSWDEDAVTMAVEAARQIVDEKTADGIDTLMLASTSFPFAVRLNAAITASALNLPPRVGAMDVGGTIRAGTTALADLLKRGDDTMGLLVAAERRVPRPASAAELRCGDGAAAVLVGPGEPVVQLLGHATTTADFVDEYRSSDARAEYSWEERWIRDEGMLQLVPETVRRALDDAGVNAREIDKLLLPERVPQVARRIARVLGIRDESVGDPLYEKHGDTGTAHPLLLLGVALENGRPGEKVLLVQFGSGCDAIVMEIKRSIPPLGILGSEREDVTVETSYMQYLAFTNQIALDWGLRAEADNKTSMSAAWRAVQTVQGFVGGRCRRCGTVQFPRSHICANPECSAADAQDAHPLAGAQACIFSFTCDWLSYYPDPPFMFGHVDFEGGARVLMEFVDCEADELSVGAPVKFAFRIKEFDRQRAFRRYGWKAVPARGSRLRGA